MTEKHQRTFPFDFIFMQQLKSGHRLAFIFLSLSLAFFILYFFLLPLFLLFIVLFIWISFWNAHVSCDSAVSNKQKPKNIWMRFNGKIVFPFLFLFFFCLSSRHYHKEKKSLMKSETSARKSRKNGIYFSKLAIRLPGKFLILFALFQFIQFNFTLMDVQKSLCYVRKISLFQRYDLHAIFAVEQFK